MIGDNPAGDIIGANDFGWKSILVRTGVYKYGSYLEPKQKPAYEVNGMIDAVKLILNSF